MFTEEENCSLTLTEAELQIIIYAVQRFYESRGDAIIGDHQTDLVLNAFRKIRKVFIDKNSQLLLTSFQEILSGESRQFKS